MRRESTILGRHLGARITKDAAKTEKRIGISVYIGERRYLTPNPWGEISNWGNGQCPLK